MCVCVCVCLLSAVVDRFCMVMLCSKCKQRTSAHKPTQSTVDTDLNAAYDDDYYGELPDYVEDSITEIPTPTFI